MAADRPRTRSRTRKNTKSRQKAPQDPISQDYSDSKVAQNRLEVADGDRYGFAGMVVPWSCFVMVLVGIVLALPYPRIDHLKTIARDISTLTLTYTLQEANQIKTWSPPNSNGLRWQKKQSPKQPAHTSADLAHLVAMALAPEGEGHGGGGGGGKRKSGGGGGRGGVEEVVQPPPRSSSQSHERDSSIDKPAAAGGEAAPATTFGEDRGKSEITRKEMDLEKRRLVREVRAKITENERLRAELAVTQNLVDELR